MLPLLISHNADILRLYEAGYDLEFIDGQYLLVHRIPYVNRDKQVRFGTIFCTLTLRAPSVLGPMGDHTVQFTGEEPCHQDGRRYEEIIINSNEQSITQKITVNYHFSSKPKGTGKYPDYYEKIRTYAAILSAPARAIDSSVTCTPRKEVANDN